MPGAEDQSNNVEGEDLDGEQRTEVLHKVPGPCSVWYCWQLKRKGCVHQPDFTGHGLEQLVALSHVCMYVCMYVCMCM